MKEQTLKCLDKIIEIAKCENISIKDLTTSMHPIYVNCEDKLFNEIKKKLSEA